MVYLLFLKILSVLFLFLLLLRFQFDGGEMTTLRAQSASPFESGQHRHRVRFAHYRGNKGGAVKEKQSRFDIRVKENNSGEIFDFIENTLQEKLLERENYIGFIHLTEYEHTNNC